MISLGVVSAQRRPKDKILDRKVFVVTMEHQTTKKKNLTPFEEELTFRSNKLTSKHMRLSDAGGFQSGEYVITEKEEMLDEMIYQFQAINKNAKGMSLKWAGRIFGDQIEGIATISKKGKVKREFGFAGAIKQKRKRK
jgi:ribosomal protein L23